MRRHYARSHSTVKTVRNGRFYRFTTFEILVQKHVSQKSDANNVEMLDLLNRVNNEARSEKIIVECVL